MARGLKVGVLTFHKCINYGSYWQARCLVEGLRAAGHDAELLNHDCRRVRASEARCALQPRLPERSSLNELRSYAAKVRRFAGAIVRLPLSPRFSLHEPEAAGKYDAIIVGSDEVWNFRHPWYGSTPIFFGDGLKADRLISYAASFGNHSAWDGMRPEWAEKLARFPHLSVRDENSWHLINGAIGRNSEIVIDPCLQFSSVARQAAAPGRPFALVYGHSFPAWLKRRARQWAERRRIPLVSVGYSNDFADEQHLDAGPIEFARLMSGTSAVITNFFHGCIFALLNGKPWATAPSDYRSIKIPDLAASLGVEHRIVGEEVSQAELSELLESPVPPEICPRIRHKRAESSAFLDAALS